MKAYKSDAVGKLRPEAFASNHFEMQEEKEQAWREHIVEIETLEITAMQPLQKMSEKIKE